MDWAYFEKALLNAGLLMHLPTYQAGLNEYNMPKDKAERLARVANFLILHTEFHEARGEGEV